MIAENNKQVSILKIPLGVEELALAFYLLGEQNRAQTILANIYEEISNEKLEGLLEAAGHSLLARNLCESDPDKKLFLNKEFSSILGISQNYQFRLQIKYFMDQKASTANIYLQDKRVFMTHYSKNENLVHTIEHGLIEEMGSYLLSMFPDFSNPQEQKSNQPEINLSRQQLEEAFVAPQSLQQARPDLLRAGLNKGILDSFIQDLQNPQYLAGILKINEETSQVESGIYLLKAQQNWLCEFTAPLNTSVKTSSPDLFFNAVSQLLTD